MTGAYLKVIPCSEFGDHAVVQMLHRPRPTSRYITYVITDRIWYWLGVVNY